MPFAVAVLTVLTALAQSAHAAEYSLQPSVSAIGTYTDNVELSPTNEIDMTGYTLRPRLLFKRDDQISQLSVDVSAYFRRFSEARYDTDDQNGSLSYLRRFERGTITASASTRHESTRTLENQDTDAGSRENEATRANANTLTLGGSYSLTERNAVQGTLAATERDYDSESSNVRGYKYYSANGLWQYTINERLLLQAQASYSRYIPEDLKDEVFTQELFDKAQFYGISGPALLGRQRACINDSTDTVPFPNFIDDSDSAPCFEPATFETEQNTFTTKLGFIYAITEKLTLDVLYGTSETGSERDQFTFQHGGTTLNRDKTDSEAYDVSLDYVSDRWSSSLLAARDDEATSDGLVKITDRVEWHNNWEASEHSTLSADLIWFDRKNSTESALLDRTDEESIIARIEYSHRFLENWTGRARYQHRAAKAVSGNDAERNEILLSLTWQPTKSVWSR